MFVHHTDNPCFGHISEPKQGLVDRVGKADAIHYESPVYLWGWDSERSCSGAPRTHFDALSSSPPVGRQASSLVCLCIGVTDYLNRLFVGARLFVCWIYLIFMRKFRFLCFLGIVCKKFLKRFVGAIAQKLKFVLYKGYKAFLRCIFDRKNMSAICQKRCLLFCWI